MTTVARVRSESRAHWYDLNGNPVFTVPKADGKGEKPTTLREARLMNLLPSVTTYLKALAKPELDAWKQEQACLAVLTSPRLTGEDLDAFVHRVLQVDKEHQQEAAQKADLGKRIHSALQEAFAIGSLAGPEPTWPEDLAIYCAKPYECIVGKLRACQATEVHTELRLVGLGYAGCSDLVAGGTEADLLVDWKSTGTLPTKGSWLEHQLQLSAYAAAWALKKAGFVKPIITGNLYISTKNPGEFVFWQNPDWRETYQKGFAPIVDFVCWSSGYDPREVQKQGMGGA